MRSEAVSRRAAIWALVVINAIGLGLRLHGLGFGLPDVFNPDETPILNRVLTFAKSGPNPHNFLYPTLYLYASAAWQGLLFIVGRAAGWYHSIGDFQRAYFVDPSRHFYAARLLTTLFGTATIAATYTFGARLCNRTTGLVAALFIAVAPYAVRDAHYVKLDVPTALFVVITHACLAGIVVDPTRARSRRAWMIAGIFAGLAMSTQYYAFFVVVPFIGIAVADILESRRWKQSTVLLCWAGTGAVLGFVATSPFFFPDLPDVLRDFRELHKVDISRTVGSGALSSLGTYVSLLARDALGWPVFVLSLAGIGIACVSDRRRAVLLAAFPLTFLAFLTNTFPASRYVNVLLPVLAVSAAYALNRVVSEQRRAVLAAVTLVVVVPGVMASVRWGTFFLTDDTRALARQFIERTAPDGSTVLLQPHSVSVRQSRDALLSALREHLGDPARASTKYQIQLDLNPYPSPSYRTIYLGDQPPGEHPLDPEHEYLSPSAFTQNAGLTPARAFDVKYVVLERYNESGPETPLQHLATVLDHDRHVTRVAEFSPYRPGIDVAQQMTVGPFFHNTAETACDPALRAARVDRSSIFGALIHGTSSPD